MPNKYGLCSWCEISLPSFRLDNYRIYTECLQTYLNDTDYIKQRSCSCAHKLAVKSPDYASSKCLHRNSQPCVYKDKHCTKIQTNIEDMIQINYIMMAGFKNL